MEWIGLGLIWIKCSLLISISFYALPALFVLDNDDGKKIGKFKQKDLHFAVH